MKKTLTANRSEKKDQFPIIGIGASEGSLPPLQAIIDGLPVTFTAPVVFVRHFSSTRGKREKKSSMVRSSVRPIIEIADAMPLENGKVYVNPLGHDVTVKAGHFHLRRCLKKKEHFPIDMLFASIAEESQDKAIAVVLSGTGSDGARGIRAVRCKGGAVLVQDPATAQFAAMPQSAIEAGNIDEVLTPERIAKRIVSLASAIVEIDGSFGISEQAALDTLFTILYEKTGYGFQCYKRNVISRRVQRRMSLQGISKIDDYRDLIGKDPAEIGRLASDIMIGVTGFFRDPDAWESLNRNVVTALIADVKTPESIRVWTTGCSTGEEAYSIAMMLLREIEFANKRTDVQVFATDINEKALSIAREGKYPASVAADIPPEYLKYFTFSEDGLHVRVNKYLRDHVVFAKQNLLVDPPFSKLDLLICRNLLIYFEPEFQDKCISIFHYALKENGYLFLGNGESMGRHKVFFKSLGDKGSGLYQRMTPTRPIQYVFPTLTAPQSTINANTNGPAMSPDRNMAEFARETLLSLYAPASVLINYRYEILYFNDPIKNFIAPPAGQSSFDFVSWFPEESRNRMRGALYSASQASQPVSITINLPDANNRDRTAVLIVRLYRSPADQSDMYLIVFTDQTLPPSEITAMRRSEADRAAILQLEREISITGEELQTNIEELRTANEELQASNEEMQSSNEELKTSQEDLQSVNEELITVNEQLNAKVEELRQSEQRFRLALKNAPVSVAAQDKKLRFIWAYNQRTIDPAEVTGKTDRDIFAPEDAQKLMALKRNVMETGQETREQLWLTSNGKRVFIDLYIEPLRSESGEVIGVGLATVDLTQMKFAEEALQESEERYRALAENIPDLISRFDTNLRLIYANPAVLQWTGLPEEALVGRTAREYGASPESAVTWEKTAFQAMESGEPQRYELSNRWQGQTRFVDIQIVPERDADGAVRSVINIARDITERKRAEQALRESEERFRIIAETVPVLVCVTRLADSVVLFTNEYNNKAFGLRGEDIIGSKGPNYYCDPADRIKMTEVFRKQGFVDNYQVKVKKNDGTPFWIMTSVRSITFEGYPAIIGASIDITESKRAEESIRTTKEQLSAVFNGVSETLMLLDLEGTILAANKLADLRLNQGKTDFVGKKISDLIPVQFHAQRKEQILEMVRTKAPVKFQNTFGDTTLDITFYPVFDDHGNVIQFVSFALDITERKRAGKALIQAKVVTEQRVSELKAVLDVANVAIWIAHDPQCLRITGNRFADEVIMGVPKGANISASARPGDAAVTYKVFCDEIELKPEELPAQVAAATGKPVADKVMELRFSNGRRVFVLMGGVPLFDAEGRVRGAVATAIDITERRKADETIRQYIEELRTNNEELARFNRVAVDRELRMIELKKEINALLKQTGQPPLYPLDFEKEKT